MRTPFTQSTISVLALCLTVAGAPLGAQSEPPPKPVRLAWGGSASMMETGALRIDEGASIDISLSGYVTDERYADLSYYRPTYEVGDAAIVTLKRSGYPHMITITAVGSGTTWLSGESAGLRILLPIIAGRAKALTVAADLPARHRVGRVKVNIAPSQVARGSLRLGVGEEASLSVEALLEESMQRAPLDAFPVTWVSSDPSVVEVTGARATPISHHMATAVARKSGSATITASVQGVKAVVPVLVGTARSGGKAPLSNANSFSTSKAPFPTATPPGPSVAASEGSGHVVLRAPEVFGAKTYVLQRSQPGAEATDFVDVATDFRLERGAVVLIDSTAPVTRDAGPALYRVVAIDHAGKAVTGEPTAVLTDGAALSGATLRRGAGGAELTWTAAPGAKYRIARFAADGSGWTTFDTAGGRYADPSPPSGAAYVLLALDGEAYAQYGPTLRLR